MAFGVEGHDRCIRFWRHDKFPTVEIVTPQITFQKKKKTITFPAGSIRLSAKGIWALHHTCCCVCTIRTGQINILNIHFSITEETRWCLYRAIGPQPGRGSGQWLYSSSQDHYGSVWASSKQHGSPQISSLHCGFKKCFSLTENTAELRKSRPIKIFPLWDIFWHGSQPYNATQPWNMPSHKTSMIKSSSPAHLPPSRSILSFSFGSSGLWSCVTSRAWSVISESFSFTPTTTAESPTWATYMWTPRITITLAVVPDVLGKPVIVLGHSAVRRKASTKSTVIHCVRWSKRGWKKALIVFKHSSTRYSSTYL